MRAPPATERHGERTRGVVCECVCVLKASQERVPPPRTVALRRVRVPLPVGGRAGGENARGPDSEGGPGGTGKKARPSSRAREADNEAEANGQGQRTAHIAVPVHTRTWTRARTRARARTRHAWHCRREEGKVHGHCTATRSRVANAMALKGRARCHGCWRVQHRHPHPPGKPELVCLSATGLCAGSADGGGVQ